MLTVDRPLDLASLGPRSPFAPSKRVEKSLLRESIFMHATLPDFAIKVLDEFRGMHEP
jgi:hypothetical protein